MNPKLCVNMLCSPSGGALMLGITSQFNFFISFDFFQHTGKKTVSSRRHAHALGYFSTHFSLRRDEQFLRKYQWSSAAIFTQGRIRNKNMEAHLVSAWLLFTKHSSCFYVVKSFH